MISDYRRNKNIKASYRIGILLLSFFYAYVLANYIPMDGSIKDRLNYLEYAGSSEVIALRYLSDGYLALVVNEPVWLSINLVLNQLLDPEATLKLIIFFTAFVKAYLVLCVNPKYFAFLLFILFFPQVIGKSVVHIRQGLAIGFFLMGWFTLSKPWKWFLFALSPLIHASFFFVLFLYGFTWLLKQLRFAIDLRTIAVVLLGVGLSLGLGFLAAIFGARQAEEYEFSSTEVSGLGFLFWLCVFVLYLLQGRRFAKANAFAMTAIAFYLSTYFLIEVTARIFESMIVIVLLSSLSLTSWRRKFFIVFISGFVGLSWLLRINQPWLGWGAGF
ncbi:EpsG family protein [Aliidiomarina sanyensis]|uniref:EpsG family protein n=1 Tax=Aliidiomarina sanyensis TaxID=1249555 RepID=A0A432WAV3_9GAMM|nr:EpsG family protein [Aliidiomarina sanyensis]RUO27871.1 hypothetical protein CWE11_11230 [Aliidiomarina sanyensis]